VNLVVGWEILHTLLYLERPSTVISVSSWSDLKSRVSVSAARATKWGATDRQTDLHSRSRVATPASPLHVEHSVRTINPRTPHCRLDVAYSLST
jgi:hypothetical protein